MKSASQSAGWREVYQYNHTPPPEAAPQNSSQLRKSASHARAAVETPPGMEPGDECARTMDANADTPADEKEASDDAIGLAVADVEPRSIEQIESKSKGEELTYVRIAGDGLRLHLILPDPAVREMRDALPSIEELEQ